MNAIIHHLKELGLNDKQARIYLALVELGRGTAYAVAIRARVKRPTAYVILDELREKGLALKIPHTKNQIFIAKDPGELFADHEEKLREAKKMLPELLARASDRNRKTRAYFFEGRGGMEKALGFGIDRLRNTELLCFFAKSDNGVSREYLERDKTFLEYGVRIRAIAPAHPSLRPFRKNDRAPGRDIRILPVSEFSPDASVEISESFVRIFLHRDAQALIIESADFSHVMKLAFELAWKNSKAAARSDI